MRDVSLATIERLLKYGCTLEKSFVSNARGPWYRVALPDGGGYGRPTLEDAVREAIEHFEPVRDGDETG